MSLASNGTELMDDLNSIPEIEDTSPELKSMKFHVDDTGVSVNVKGNLKGPQTTTIKIGTFSFKVKLNSAVVAEVRIAGIDLKKDHHEFDLSLQIEPQILGDREDIKRGIDGIGSGKFVGVTAGLKGFSIKNSDESTIVWLDTFLSKIDVCFSI